MKNFLTQSIAHRVLFIMGCGLLLAAWLIFTATPGWSAGPPNMVTNGTFTSNTAYWTTLTASTFNTTGCSLGNGIAYMADPSIGDVTAYQCIHILTRPDSDSYTLQGDGMLVDGDFAYLLAIFYTSDDCTGGSLGDISLLATPFGSGPGLSHISNSATVVGANSAQVLLELGDTAMGAVEACYDNISLGGPNATLVQLQDIEAHPAEPNPGQMQLSGGLALAGLLILALQVSLRRKTE